ncbi:aldo/keto reductase family protein [Clostridium beijerinckii]|uniref:Alcohol dehydrogenase (NADP+) n=1 Tax=Clostridium beijerinckii TaxID=1520 RepID=A0A9Q5CPR4_CLOBE|nr:aldo/keto reductase [Clostridium beijerinckii]AQS06460.1 putative oxidoreductase YtbE [Clostridium beijerinckii]MBA2885837.1 alcohol dehydrogenase (NADP+) [Clostridium beijerinckii]MBA2900462.1 alcohol dehydrogenase (NADP+) [Clostridium beijerinckii]MBA2910396.1 alcohol dehydrogenase (NADP+) [Clostridium beijerinckii]MBA9013920.1 alcohol dehydrogenase (NADP+) [Clostridium beijerinckii]
MNFTPIDPNKVPQRTLYTGAKMPGIGMGTFGSDRFSAEDIANAVKGAAKLGFRLFDGASVYGNEDLIGEVYKEILASGVKREELFITSKVWNDQHDNVIESCKKTLKDLQLDYLDCYFVHWPFPNFHAKGVSVDSRDPNAKPYIHEDFMKTWRQMEQLVEMGLVKHIGTSSVTIPKLKLILRDAKIKPAVNEMELHPCFQQPELYKFCKDNGIEVIGFCPIGSPTRPDRDKTDDDIADIEEPTVVKIAKAHNVHPAVICVKWGVQHGHTPIPFSIHENEYYSNLLSAVEDPLTDEEMKELEAADKNCRLIKGQVFLWEGAKDWEDLWDLDGTITTL